MSTVLYPDSDTPQGKPPVAELDLAGHRRPAGLIEQRAFEGRHYQ